MIRTLTLTNDFPINTPPSMDEDASEDMYTSDSVAMMSFVDYENEDIDDEDALVAAAAIATAAAFAAAQDDPGQLYGYEEAEPRPITTTSSSEAKYVPITGGADDPAANTSLLYGYEDAAPKRRRRSSASTASSISSTQSGLPPRQRSSNRPGKASSHQRRGSNTTGSVVVDGPDLPTNVYGYEDAAPRRRRSSSSSASQQAPAPLKARRSSVKIASSKKVNSGVTKDPDLMASSDMYEYEDAAPRRRRRSSSSSTSQPPPPGPTLTSGFLSPQQKARRSSARRGSKKLSSGAIKDLDLMAPNEMYEYEDAAPRRRRRSSTTSTESQRTPTSSASANSTPQGTPLQQQQRRRSSIKMAGQPRRASIQTGAGEVRQITLITGQRVERKASISFDEAVEVNPVPRVMDMTSKPEKLWFQADEYARIREKCLKNAELIEAAAIATATATTPTTTTTTITSPLPCSRGLEGLTFETSQVKSALRHQAWNSVLDEQDRQIDKQFYDEEAMASALKLASIQSRVEAAQRAKLDAQEVECYLKSTRRYCRRLTF